MCQPAFEFGFRGFGIRSALTEHYEVICISHHCSVRDDLPLAAVAHTQGLFHPMQRNISQQRAYHATLRCPRWCLVMDTVFHVSCLQPLFDQGATGATPDGLE